MCSLGEMNCDVAAGALALWPLCVLISVSLVARGLEKTSHTRYRMSD
jgi:hypothetical protein